MQTVTLTVEGMSCGHCVKAVETGVNELNGIENVTVNLEDAKVAVSYDDEKVSVDEIKEAIEEQGYDVK